MFSSQSIPARLSRSYFVFFALVVVLGGVTVGIISYDNKVSSVIRDRWLQNALLIGDFENFSSDYRVDEVRILLLAQSSSTSNERKEMDSLGKLIALDQLKFARIANDSVESDLFHQFEKEWARYLSIQMQIMAALDAKDMVAAQKISQGESTACYQNVSDVLEKLRKYNIKMIADASVRSENTDRIILWIIAFSVLATDILAYFSSLSVRRSIFDPLIDLILKLRSLAENNTDIQISGTSRSDEIGEMARAMLLFRENILALARNKMQLEQQAIILEEQLKLEQTLSLHQRNFVSMASHEFRTPLNVIDGQAQRLLKHKSELDASEVEARTGAIRKAVQRMTGMIDSLLESARLMDGEGQLYLHAVPTNLTALLHDVCQQHREIAPHVQIMELFDAAPLPCTLDHKLIYQAFSNIIGNSIKYSGPDAQIKIDLERGETHFTATFADNGIGIEPADTAKVFDRYYRGQNVSGVVGTGLGLYLVKTIITLHGGTINLNSAPGTGCTMIVTLPYAV